jgi:hypothetical protein
VGWVRVRGGGIFIFIFKSNFSLVGVGGGNKSYS